MQRNESSMSNKRVVVIAIALILILVLAFGGYTFAKYLSEKQVTDSATVAKWGFVIDIDGSKLFGTDYTSTDGSVATIATPDGVAVSAENKVVAPGTTGEMTFSVSGTAEVLSKMAVDFTGTNDIALVVSVGGAEAATYNPIKYTLSYGETEAYGTTLVDGKTLADVQTAVEAKLNQASIAANTEVNHYFKLTWTWDFENDSVVSGTATGNDLDTVLGMYTSGAATADEAFELNGKQFTVTSAGTQTTLDLEMKITVEQILKA